jgi:hypothetical protein
MIRIPTHCPPTHPGEMLLEEFLIPMELSQRELADSIHVPYQRINELAAAAAPDRRAVCAGRFRGGVSGGLPTAAIAGVRRGGRCGVEQRVLAPVELG